MSTDQLSQVADTTVETGEEVFETKKIYITTTICDTGRVARENESWLTSDYLLRVLLVQQLCWCTVA